MASKAKKRIGKVVRFSLVLLLGIGIGIVGAALLINHPFTKETDLGVEANSEGKATKEKKIDKSNVSRIGYVVEGTCTMLYLTRSGDVYIEMATAGICEEYATEFETESFPGTAGSYKISVGKYNHDIASYGIIGDEGDIYHVTLPMKVRTSEVANAFYVNFGQSYTGDNYVLIDKYGNVSWLNIDLSTKKKVTGTIISDLEECEGVVAAQSINMGDGIGVVFIKEDGSQVDMTDRIAERISQAMYGN